MSWLISFLLALLCYILSTPEVLKKLKRTKKNPYQASNMPRNQILPSHLHNVLQIGNQYSAMSPWSRFLSVILCLEYKMILADLWLWFGGRSSVSYTYPSTTTHLHDALTRPPRHRSSWEITGSNLCCVSEYPAVQHF